MTETKSVPEILDEAEKLEKQDMNRKERRASRQKKSQNPNDYCRFVGISGDLRMRVIHDIAVTSILWGFPPDGFDRYAERLEASPLEQAAD